MKNLCEYYASRSSCRECYKSRVFQNRKNNPEINLRYRQKNLEKIRHNDKMRSREYRLENSETVKRSRDLWIASNIELNIRLKKVWRQENKSKINQLASKRRAYKAKALPKWLTKSQKAEIQRIYDECPAGYHVDHIIPLKGRNCCGLHVPWNLQYLTAEDNLKKSNKVA